MKKSFFIFLMAVVFLIQNTLPVFARTPNDDSLRALETLQPRTENRSFRSPLDSKQGNMTDFVPISSMPLTGPGALTSVYYNVHVLGEVARPGVYKVLPSDRLSDALRYAGGALLNGSQRFLEHRRGNSVRSLDLFLYKTKGDLSQNPFLMDNDVVYVPLKKGEVQIEGPVNRPGFYEMTGDVSVAQIINLAGGFTAGLDMSQPLRVIRYGPIQNKEVLAIEMTQQNLNRFKLQKGDVIVAPHVLTRDKEFDYSLERIPGDNLFLPTAVDYVYVVGSVQVPGAYNFKPQYKWRDYISYAGLGHDLKAKYIRLVRPDGKRIKVNNSTQVNPGDTLVVSSKYWKFETILSMVTAIANVTNTSLLIRNEINRN